MSVIQRQCGDTTLNVGHHAFVCRSAYAAIAAFEFGFRYELGQVRDRGQNVGVADARAYLALQFYCRSPATGSEFSEARASAVGGDIVETESTAAARVIDFLVESDGIGERRAGVDGNCG